MTAQVYEGAALQICQAVGFWSNQNCQQSDRSHRPLKVHSYDELKTTNGLSTKIYALNCDEVTSPRCKKVKFLGVSFLFACHFYWTLWNLCLWVVLVWENTSNYRDCTEHCQQYYHSLSSSCWRQSQLLFLCSYRRSAS